jgi:hypothetical protein
MCKRLLGLLAVAFSLFGTQCWAGTCVGAGVPPSCTNTFSPGTTSGTYDFSVTGDGKLIVTFNTVLTPFDLTVTVNHTIDAFDPNEFPAGTVAVTYCNGNQDQYDFTGNSGGPNGVPVRNINYKGLITLELIYCVGQTVHTPAFAHAPGPNVPTAMFKTNFLRAYDSFPQEEFPRGDPTMCGTLPDLSSIVAADELLTESDTYCWVSPPNFQTFPVGQDIEVSFQLFPSGFCPNNPGPPIRDKTASLSLSTTDPTTGNTVFPPRLTKEEGNKFHFDNTGLNEFDLSTEGLPPGAYRITVISSKFSPQTRHFTLMSSPGMICLTLSSGLVCF